jgi:cold shock CspA family protein
MSFEFNQDDTFLNEVANPFRYENWFLFIAALAAGAGGVTALVTAKELFKNQDDKVALVAVAVAVLVLGIAVKLLIQGLSHVRFFLGRGYPRGLAGELPVTEAGVGIGTEEILDTLRHRAIEFPEPKGPLNGVLYSMVKSLVTSPSEVQAAAVQHFHSLVAMVALFASLVVSYFVFHGTAYEGLASWIYLPMAGLTLLTPFTKPDSLNLQSTESVQPVETGDKALWKLMGLVVFSVMAPVLIPRMSPELDIAPMWVAPALLLIGSMVASGLFFCAIVSRLDSAARTSVSCEQTTIAMNCPPAQLWTEMSRDFQSSWVRGIPNRTYAHVPPEVTEDERGSFGGFVLEETQPVPTSTMQFATWAEAFQTRYTRFLLLLGAWGVATSAACGWAAVHFTAQFPSMTRMEISRAVLMVMALGMVAVLSFRIGHLLWSRMQFKSRIMWIETSGVFQSSQISVGNQFRGSAMSSSTLTRVQDATLRVWVTDIVSVAFGKDGKRSIIAMASADGVAKGIASRLIDFAAQQSSIATPTADRDLVRAASIGGLDAAVRAATASAMKRGMSDAITGASAEQTRVIGADDRIAGRVKFYDAIKSYGYIVAESGEEYFFNDNCFRGDAPRKGDRVEFQPERGPKGLMAKRMLLGATA